MIPSVQQFVKKPTYSLTQARQSAMKEVGRRPLNPGFRPRIERLQPFSNEIFQTMTSVVLLAVEVKGSGVDTVSSPCRLRSVGKNVAKMRFAIRAGNLLATHTVA